MKNKNDEVKEFLKDQLKRNDLTSESITHLNGVLRLIESQEEENKSKWKEFVKTLLPMQNTWQENYPFEDFNYEFRKYESKDLCSITLNFGNKNYNTWIFEVSVFMKPEMEIYFSSIEEDMETIEFDSFNELFELIENVFKSDDYKEMLEEIKERFLS